MRTIVRYASLANAQTSAQDVAEAIGQLLGQDAQEAIMTPFLRDVLEARRQGEIDGETKGRNEGRGEGRAASVIAFAQARQLPISEDARQRILSCNDIPTLDRWIVRVATASTLESVFEDA